MRISQRSEPPTRWRVAGSILPSHECSSMLDAVAIIILAGMMLIPGINLLVGIVAGGASFGVSGGFAGTAIAVLITLAENQLIDRRVGSTPRPSAEIISFPDP